MGERLDSDIEDFRGLTPIPRDLNRGQDKHSHVAKLPVILTLALPSGAALRAWSCLYQNFPPNELIQS